MSAEGKRAYAQVTTLEKAGVMGHKLLLPGVILWSICTRYFYAETRAKSLTRVVNDASLRHLTKLEIPQLQYMFGTTDNVYRTWAQENGVPLIKEDLGDDAKLYWLGPKQTERVILYLHGGGCIFPMLPAGLSFWKYVQEQLRAKERDTGVAVLKYTLLPEATFPVQLQQVVLALQHLLDLGVSPRNIQLGGDSNGGNLTLQLISHALHPFIGVPPLKLDSPLRGAFLMSPCTQLSDTEKFSSFKIAHDVITGRTATRWVQALLNSGLPNGTTPYVEALRAPDDWFQGIGAVVERLLITTGDLDVLRDMGMEFQFAVKKHHPDVNFILQANGVHDGPFFDFITRRPEISQLTLDIIEWYASGF